MEIRRAELEDAGILSALCVDVQLIHAQAHPHIFKLPQSDEFAIQFMQERLADPLNYFFIASLDGEDIGYVFSRIVEREENPYMHAWRYIYIDQISVMPDHQGKGYGAQLIERVRALADQEGIETIALDTWYFNEAAQGFFSHQGFMPFNLRLWRVGN